MSNHARPHSRSRPPETDRAVRRLVEKVYGRGELQHVDGLVRPDYVGHWVGTGQASIGPAGVKHHVTRFRRALGRVGVDVETLETTGGAFEVRWTASGRLERPFLGVEPECQPVPAGEEPHGPSVTLSAVTRGTVRGGQLLESETTWVLAGPGVDAASPASAPARTGIESRDTPASVPATRQ